MEKKNLLFKLAIGILVSLSVAGCSNNDEDEPITPASKPVPGIFVLNSGKYEGNNGSISFCNIDKNTAVTDTFSIINGRGLGDTPNDMILYGSKMYVAVYRSNVIDVIDLSGKSIKQIKSTSSDPLLPRHFTAYNGKVYVSLFDGNVARIDTTSLAIEATTTVGRNPEGLVVANNKLYVANSGGLDYNKEIGYDKTVSVVDLSTFKEIKKINVVTNPVNLVKDNQEDVYLVSMGDYKNIPNTFQRIDSKSDAVTTITETNATELVSTGNTLYMMYSQYDANWNQVISFISYDAINEKVLSNNFVTDGTTITKPYKIGADSSGKYIYITTSDYKNNGDVYVFDQSGKKVYQFSVGLNPISAAFVNIN
ncbi:MAG: hypothetical protein WCS17_14210 [Prevotella sp.]|nr:hypothetical protein [Parabacteroides sp.]